MEPGAGTESAAATTGDLTRRAEAFLYHEADLLDRCAYAEWFALFDEDGTYYVPATDMPHAASGEALFLISDDYQRLEGRVTRLQSRDAHADYPHPRTRRFITNVRVEAGDGPPATDERAIVVVKANFLIYSLRVGNVFQFIGAYTHLLRDDGERFTIKSRRAELDLETLDYAGGKINLIV